jgi:hypothetical protein
MIHVRDHDRSGPNLGESIDNLVGQERCATIAVDIEVDRTLADIADDPGPNEAVAISACRVYKLYIV